MQPRRHALIDLNSLCAPCVCHLGHPQGAWEAGLFVRITWGLNMGCREVRYFAYRHAVK